LVEVAAPCILWIDEIEKALAGVGSSSYTDGGTAARVFATIATWLQEKTAPVFVVATANAVTSLNLGRRFTNLPPENSTRKNKTNRGFWANRFY
jgi:SpoVK/Ycf46/Vps4 family AAA+-type ATPase